jgi:hypothetical protein
VDSAQALAGRLAMRVLFRVAAALLIAIPVLLVLVIVFAVSAKRAGSLPFESVKSGSSEGDTSVGTSLRESALIAQESS